MSVEFLMGTTIILFAVMGLGLIYLILVRLKRSKREESGRMERLGSELMQKLESTSLSDEQKTKIAETLKEINQSRAQSTSGV